MATVAALILTFCTTRTWAENITPSTGMYLGAGVGPSHTDFKLNTSRQDEYFDIVEKATLRKLYLGYRFHRHYGIEVSGLASDKYGFARRSIGSLIHTPENDFSSTTVRRTEESITAFAIKHVGYFSVSDYVTITASLGILNVSKNITDVESRTRTTTPQTGAPTTTYETIDYSIKEQQVLPLASVGIRMHLGKVVDAQLTLERFFKAISIDPYYGEANIDTISFELLYRL